MNAPLLSVTLTVINELGRFESVPFPQTPEGVDTIKNNLQARKLEMLSFPARNNQEITITKYWLDKSILLWHITQEPTSPAIPAKIEAPPPEVR